MDYLIDSADEKTRLIVCPHQLDAVKIVISEDAGPGGFTQRGEFTLSLEQWAKLKEAVDGRSR